MRAQKIWKVTFTPALIVKPPNLCHNDFLIPSRSYFWVRFQEMAVIVVGTGCVFSLIFHVGTHEPPQTIKEKNKGKRQH